MLKISSLLEMISNIKGFNVLKVIIIKQKNSRHVKAVFQMTDLQQFVKMLKQLILRKVL